MLIIANLRFKSNSNKLILLKYMAIAFGPIGRIGAKRKSRTRFKNRQSVSKTGTQAEKPY